MRVLVVGASGFLGSHIYQLLKSATDVSVSGTCGRNPLFTSLYPVDLESPESVRSMMKHFQPDVVIWCAKHAGYGSEHSLNAVGLGVLLATANSEMRLVFVSTDGLLPGVHGNYDERTTPVPINSDSDVALYTNSKLQAEKFIAASLDNYCIVRVGPIYGQSVTGAWDQRILGLTGAFTRGESVLRATNIRRTFVNVEDLARALCDLGESDYRGIIHFGPLESASHYDFARTVCRVFGFRESLVESYEVSQAEVAAKAVRVDTTLDTRAAAWILRTQFRTLSEWESGMKRSFGRL